MRYEKQVMISVPAAEVWTVLADVGSWPVWTPTVTCVQAPPGVLAEGSEVSIKQPRRRPVRYTVTRLEERRSFRWGRSSGGVAQSADHVIEAFGPGACRVTLTFEMSGPLGGVLGVLGARTIRAMVDTEATSLKRHFERPDRR